MSLDEIDQNSNNSENNINNITLSTSIDTNNVKENNINLPTETDLLNDPESSIEPAYNVEEEKISPVNIKEKQENNTTTKPYLFYGNHITNLHPKYLGKTRALFYYNDSPLIIIGPDCKLNYFI